MPKPMVQIQGVFEATYISTPKENKPVYVQATLQGDRTPVTFSFSQTACPVTDKGQIFGGTFTGEYQVYVKPQGEKDSHTFAITKIENLKRYNVTLVPIQ